MKRITLKAEPRTIVGTKVKKLRVQGLIPANIYGHKVESTAITLKAEEFKKVFIEAGETGVIDLDLSGQSRPVLIKNVQVHAVSGLPLHVDCYQVDLTVKVKANVPLQVEGVAPAVTDNLGVLLELVNELEVEALPQDLPDHITVDISKLTAVDQGIKIGELALPANVVLVDADAETEVVKIGELVQAEPEPEPVAAETTDAAATEGEEGKAEGGEKPAEGAEPSDKKEPQKEEKS